MVNKASVMIHKCFRLVSMDTITMNIQTGRAVKIILSIQRGVGFNFLKDPFAVYCTINNHVLKSELIKPRHTPIFDCRLIWETTISDFERFCLTNVPVKVEIVTQNAYGENQLVGYIILSLLSAKVCPPFDENKVNFNWHRLLGIKSKGLSSNPQLLIKLILEDKKEKALIESSKMTHYFINNKENIENNHDHQMNNHIDTTLKFYENGYIKIGNNVICDKLYSLNIDVKEKKLELLSPANTDSDKTLHYINILLFGKKNMIKYNSNDITFNIKSDYSIIAQYFNENPYLIIQYCNQTSDLGVSFVDMRNFITKDDTKLKTLNESEPLIHKERCFFINQNQSSADYERPYLDIELSLICNNQAHDISLDSSKHTNKSEIVDTSSDQTSDHNKYKNTSNIEQKYKTIKTTTIKSFNDNQIRMNKEEKIFKNESRMPSDSNENNIIQVINELEDWMEHQKEMFKSYMIEKENKHLELLKSEWDGKRVEYENTLKNNIEQCQNLMLSLNEIVDSLKEKELQLEDREKKLRYVKEELELDYKSKFQELKNASSQMEHNFEHQLKLHEIEYNKLSAEIKLLKQENISLKTDIRNIDSKRSSDVL